MTRWTALRARGRRKQPSWRAGAAAAELAVALPFIAFLFAAAVDYGRVYYYTQTIDNSAMAGALYASGTAVTAASTQGTDGAAKAAACAEATTLNPPLQPAQVSVSSDAATVSVTVSYDFPVLTPLLTQSGVISLTRTVTMNRAPTAWK